MSDPRFDAVAAVLQEYFDGLCHSDTQRLRRVFHPQAVYACATAEPAVILRMDEYFTSWTSAPRPPAGARRCRSAFCPSNLPGR